MSYIVVFINHSREIDTLQLVRKGDFNRGDPATFQTEQAATEWANVSLGDMPYQVLAIADFKSASERI